MIIMTMIAMTLGTKYVSAIDAGAVVAVGVVAAGGEAYSIVVSADEL